MYFVIVLFFFSYTLGILINTPCSWKDANGNFYDLSPLSKLDGDYFLPRNDENQQPFDLWINLCHGTLNVICESDDVSGCQEWDPNIPDGHASLGKASSIKFSKLGNDIF